MLPLLTRTRNSTLRASLALAAFVACAHPARSETLDVSGENEGMPAFLRNLPLNKLAAGTILVAGERLSVFYAQGDSLRPMVHARKPGAPWRLVRKPDPTANGRKRVEWRLPVDLSGTVELRFSEPSLGHPLDSVTVAVTQPAGSGTIGPVLDSALEAPENDFTVGSNFIPYRNAADLAALQQRLALAEGGRKCLPDIAVLRQRAMAEARGFSGGLPILVSRVRYHHRDRSTYALTAREFRAVGFPVETLSSQRVLFMLDDANLFSNKGEQVVGVRIRIGQDTLNVRRNAQREYTFASDGMQTVFLKAFTAKGESWEQATVVEVIAAKEGSAGDSRAMGDSPAAVPGASGELAAGAARADSLGQDRKARN